MKLITTFETTIFTVVAFVTYRNLVQIPEIFSWTKWKNCYEIKMRHIGVSAEVVTMPTE